MRSYIKAQWEPPTEGDFRIVDKFAWWPKKIITFKGQSNNRELTNYYWMWLEHYKEEQEYVEIMIPSLHNVFMLGSGSYRWKTRRIFQ